MSYTRFLWVLVLASGLANAVPTNLDGTITYQAQIKQNGSPANGTFDFQFRLFDEGTVGVGNAVGSTVLINDVVIVNGQLSTNLKFGPSDLVNSTQLFLEVGIRDGASNQPYTLLNPRQRLTEVPFASYADHADFANVTGPNSVTGGSIVDGTIKTADIDATLIQRRVTGTCAAGNAIRTVAQDGTVTCEPVSGGAGGGDITSVNTAIGSGLTGGNTAGDVNLSIAASGVTSAMILDGTITANDIGANAVGTTEINETQVQRRVTGACTTGQVLQSVNQDGTVVCVQGGGGSGGGWGLTGNSGTTAGTNFVGTTDGQPLVIKVNNSRAGQYAQVFGFINSAVQGTGISILNGDPGNSIGAAVVGATIAGGGRAAGPNPNIVSDAFGTVSGGYGNTAGNGSTATNDALSATVGGGHSNRAQANDATVAGGAENIASGIQSTVGGGDANTASGHNALIPGGRGNVASGVNSVAIGNCGSATGPGTILIRASQDAVSCNQISASGADSVTVVAGNGGGVVLNSGGGSWSTLSDRNSKHAIVPVDSDSILAGVLAMPIATWTYNSQDDGIRHMGPMAQDFYGAFSLGESEKRINSVDIDGVALAAIQGLHEKMERENTELKQRNAELEAKNAEMEQRLIRLEQTLLGNERNAGR